MLCVPRELGVVTSHTTDPDTPEAPDDPVAPVAPVTPDAPDAPDAPEAAPATVVVDSRSPTNTVESVEPPADPPASEHPAPATDTSTAHAAPVATTDTPRHRPPDPHNRDMTSDGTDHTPPREVSTLTRVAARLARRRSAGRAAHPASNVAAMPNESWDVVVVGSGPGGLTAAACLAATGRRVLVTEAHDVAGGNAQVFRRHPRRGSGRDNVAAAETASQFDLEASRLAMLFQQSQSVLTTVQAYWQARAAADRVEELRRSVEVQGQLGNVTRAMIAAERARGATVMPRDYDGSDLISLFRRHGACVLSSTTQRSLGSRGWRSSRGRLGHVQEPPLVFATTRQPAPRKDAPDSAGSVYVTMRR